MYNLDFSEKSKLNIFLYIKIAKQPMLLEK